MANPEADRDPPSHWWQGALECSICGFTFQAAIEILEEHDEPILPLECSRCGNMTATPE